MPPAREAHSLFMDRDRGALVLLGGYGEYFEPFTDIWAYGLGAKD